MFGQKVQPRNNRKKYQKSHKIPFNQRKYPSSCNVTVNYKEMKEFSKKLVCVNALNLLDCWCSVCTTIQGLATCDFKDSSDGLHFKELCVRTHPCFGKGLYSQTFLEKGTVIGPFRPISTFVSHVPFKNIYEVWAEKLKFFTNHMSLADNAMIKGLHPRNIDDGDNLIDKLRMNSFGWNQPQTIRILFDTISAINHSCFPNAEIIIDKNSVSDSMSNSVSVDLLFLHDIQQGEEITINYRQGVQDTEMRHCMISKCYDFVCSDSRCLKK